MSKWTALSLLFGFGSLILGFVGEAAGSKGMKEELIDELSEEYVLVPRNKDE